ncbi:apoptosis regulator BAX [Tetranychus urticae]|uniref:Bcl-2 Bcl-2 homology region 1-3 domain-containing protein n=1 Tax=Tetranychus urticae TaxID=32264 RepID=T1L0A7_TETUR|nr:apoptosis regulator BAX [Tetranychus urticae]
MAIGIRIEETDQDGSPQQQIYITRGGEDPEQIVLPYDETAATAQMVFSDIYHRTFFNEGIRPPESTIDFLSHYEVCAEQMLTSVGEDLRRIAAKIEASSEREKIRRRARSVNLRIDSFERFSAMLKGLFPDNHITRERIVVLFFFCSDIAVRAYSSSPVAHFHKLIGWSLKFIFSHICSLVRSQGGWNKVISNFVQGTAITVCAILGSVAFAMYIKRNF